jgi:Beta-lactamase superfamily domain
MALTVKALNNDTSFLLTFAPPITPVNVEHPELFPGAFTILIDPWLTGPAVLASPKLSTQEHTEPSCVESLQDLPEADLILISQDKPDHCHEETLCQLSPHTETTILGTPAAAKKIRAWGHFDFSCIQTVKKFKENDPSTVYRIEIPSFSPNGTPGEVTICLLEPRRDFTRVHNAIGITYRPPCSVLSLSMNSYVNLPQTPPASSPYTVHSPRSVTSSTSRPPLTAPSSTTSPTLLSPTTPGAESASTVRPMTPRFVSARANTIVPSPYASQNHEKTVSVLYSPHGVDYPVIQPWASSHLVSCAALPLTLLLHSFNLVTAPWYMGGIMAAGMPGGIHIAKNLLPKVWIGAHDEDKRASGLALKKIVRQVFDVSDIRKKLWDEVDTQHPRLGSHTDVMRLAAGKEWRMGFREVSEKELKRTEERRKKEKEEKEKEAKDKAEAAGTE